MSKENELPEGWAIAKLEDICTIIMGQSPPSSDYNEHGKGLPFFQGKAEFTSLYPVIRKWCTAAMRIAEANDILLSVRAPVGPTNLAPSQCCIGRGLAAIRPVGGIQVYYILYAIRTFNSFLLQLATGTTFEAVSGDSVRSLEIPLAPLPEQQRIVSVIEQQFTRLDATVAALQQDKAKLKRARASVLKSAVEGKLTEAWRAEHPATESAPELLERILAERRAKWEAGQLAKMEAKGMIPKDDKWKDGYKEPAMPDVEGLPKLPEGWCWAKIDQISQIQGGIQKQPSRIPRENAFPYLRVANVFRSRLDLSVIEKMELFGNELDLLRLEIGDLLIVEGNGSRTEIGRSALWHGEIKDCVHQNHIIRVRLNHIIPQYLDCYWNSPEGRNRVMDVAASTSGLYTLSVGKISRLPLPLPPLAEQQQIVAEVERRLSVIEQVEIAVKASLKRAERLRQSILKMAFSGRLVPQDPNDEPASVLLERIRKERAEHKQGTVNKRHVVPVVHADEVEPIDIEGTQQAGLWESVSCRE